VPLNIRVLKNKLTTPERGVIIQLMYTLYIINYNVCSS
jgi:hypothetical protein